MRNCVVDMQNIEGFGLEDFEHFCGERQRVRRVIKERIGDDLDLVKEDVRVGGIHPDGRSVTDEMDVVPARSELLSQLRSHDAGAAIRGIACDADAHETAALSPLRVAAVPYIKSVRALLTCERGSSDARVAHPVESYPIRRRSTPERDTAKRERGRVIWAGSRRSGSNDAGQTGQRSEKVNGCHAAAPEKEPGYRDAGIRAGIGVPWTCDFAA